MKPADFVRLAAVLAVALVSLGLADHTIATGTSGGPAEGRYPVPDAMALGGMFAFVFWSFVFERMDPIMIGPVATTAALYRARRRRLTEREGGGNELTTRAEPGGDSALAEGAVSADYCDDDVGTSRMDAMVWLIFFLGWTIVRSALLVAAWLYWRNASALTPLMTRADPRYNSVLLLLAGAALMDKFWLYLISAARGAAAVAATFAVIFSGAAIYYIADGGQSTASVILLAVYIFVLIMLSFVTCMRAYREVDSGGISTDPNETPLRQLLRATFYAAPGQDSDHVISPWNVNGPTSGDGVPSLIPVLVFVAFFIYMAVDTAGITDPNPTPSVRVVDARTRAYGVDALPFVAFLAYASWYPFNEGEYGAYIAGLETYAPTIFFVPGSAQIAHVLGVGVIGAAQFLYWRNVHESDNYVWGMVLGVVVMGLAIKVFAIIYAREGCTSYSHWSGATDTSSSFHDYSPDASSRWFAATSIFMITVAVGCALFCTFTAAEVSADATMVAWIVVTSILFILWAMLIINRCNHDASRPRYNPVSAALATPFDSTTVPGGGTAQSSTGIPVPRGGRVAAVMAETTIISPSSGDPGITAPETGVAPNRATILPAETALSAEDRTNLLLGEPSTPLMS